MLEAHYFFTPGATENEPATFGWGPFVAIEPTGDDVLDGMGFGLPLGWRVDEDSGKSFNVGLGRFLNRDVKRLAPGFRDQRQLPGGESEIRFKETDEWSNLLMFSFTWTF